MIEAPYLIRLARIGYGMNVGNNSPIASELKFLAKEKEADRKELDGMPPDQAQAVVERILFPRLWRVNDPVQLSWPGDLADDADD